MANIGAVVDDPFFGLPPEGWFIHSKDVLENYEWKKDDGHRHLLLGITVEGLIRFLERIKVIRWTREEDTDEDYKLNVLVAVSKISFSDTSKYL